MLEKLKQALKNAGLNEGLASMIDITKITDESQIANVVAQLKGDNAGPSMTAQEMLSSEVFNNYLKENGFDSVLKLNKALQSEHDRKVYQGVKTFKEKILGDPQDPNPNPQDPKGPADPQEGMPEWFKPFAKTIGDLATSKTVETKLEKARKAMAEAKLPKNLKESWISRIDLESETPYEDQIKSLEEEYKSIHVGIVGKDSYEFEETYEGKPSKNGKMSEKERLELEAFAKGEQ
jgi:hypothetical protein